MLPFHDDALIEARVLAPGDGSWFVAQPVVGGPPLDVHGVAPGDRVLLRRDGEGPGRAEVAALLKSGPGRRTPPCALAARCGGCHWLHLDESLQRALRRVRLADDLRAAGVATAGIPIRSVGIPSVLAGRARARFQTHFGPASRRVGLHRLGRRETIDVPRCPVLAPEAARVYAWLRQELPSLAGPGLTGFEITALPHAPGALLYLNPRDVEPPGWPALGRALLDRSGGLLAGVAVRRGAPADIAGRSVIAGRSPAGHPLAACARGFMQSNLAAADRLADEVVRLVRAGEGTRVLELFAGTGLLGWRLAAAGAQVIGIESEPLAADAVTLLPRPPRGRFRLVVGDARTAVLEADVLVADPPRAGLGPPLAARVAESGPGRVVLVSCSTRALARDLALLTARGYKLRELCQVDVFPQTRHAETVALLER